jgi:hypothetical protein
MKLQLPEIGSMWAMTLALIGLVGGILMGTHQDWWVQVGALIAMAYVIEHSHLEMGAFAYVPGWVLFAVGCIIGDISWWFQTGGIEVHMPNMGNPFSVL